MPKKGIDQLAKKKFLEIITKINNPEVANYF